MVSDIVCRAEIGREPQHFRRRREAAGNHMFADMPPRRRQRGVNDQPMDFPGYFRPTAPGLSPYMSNRNVSLVRADAGNGGDPSGRRSQLQRRFWRRIGRESDRGTVPLNPGNAGGGKAPDFWCAFDDGEEGVIGDESRNTRKDQGPSEKALW